jgi:hypothetical protein
MCHIVLFAENYNLYFVFNKINYKEKVFSYSAELNFIKV